MALQITENSLQHNINELSLNDLRVYCNQIIDENMDLKKQITQMSKLFKVFNDIKDKDNYKI